MPPRLQSLSLTHTHRNIHTDTHTLLTAQLEAMSRKRIACINSVWGKWLALWTDEIKNEHSRSIKRKHFTKVHKNCSRLKPFFKMYHPCLKYWALNTTCSLICLSSISSFHHQSRFKRVKSMRRQSSESPELAPECFHSLEPPLILVSA